MCYHLFSPVYKPPYMIFNDQQGEHGQKVFGKKVHGLFYAKGRIVLRNTFLVPLSDNIKLLSGILYIYIKATLYQ